MLRKLSCALILGSVLLISSCRVYRGFHVRHGGALVVVSGSHVHTDRCGHYRHGNRWFLLNGHRHGMRCGHAFTGGHWTLK